MADKSNNWAMVDLSAQPGGAQLVLRVSGADIPVAQFSMSYGLNDIPKATALIALGRDARTGEPSAIYAQIKTIKQMARARVFIVGNLGDWSPRGANGVKEYFPTSTNTSIFIGYVAGTSYRRSSGQISLVLNLVSKLVDLALSSGGSKDVVPGSPNDLMLPTLTEGSGVSGEASNKFTDQLEQDLIIDFSEAILKVLMKVSEESQIQTHEADFWCGGLAPAGSPISDRAGNGRAAAVIKPGAGDRWQGISNLATGTDVDKFLTKYPLKVGSACIPKACSFIGGQVSASLASTSMWGMLIGSILPNFGCGIIPWASGAIIAPILDMARDAQITIKADEYADFDLTTQSQRPLYGVGVMGNFEMGTLPQSEEPKLCTGAVFVAKNEDGSDLNDGMWLFVNTPGWTDNWTNSEPGTADGESNPDIVKTLTEPSHDAAGIAVVAIDRKPEEQLIPVNDAMQQYAKMMYASNALRGREGSIVGKLRFDVAPGTTILVQARGDNYLSAGVDTLATDMYAFVAKVHISINAENASATTSFEVTNLRTAAENNSGSERFSMLEHPFFAENYFKYVPLVPMLSVPSKGYWDPPSNPPLTAVAGEVDQTLTAVAGEVDQPLTAVITTALPPAISGNADLTPTAETSGATNFLPPIDAPIRSNPVVLTARLSSVSDSGEAGQTTAQ